MTNSTTERLDSLLDTLTELFPEGGVGLDPGLRPGTQGWRLVPSARNPRLAVPATVPRAAMSSAIRPCASDGLLHKARRYALAAVLRTPVADRLMTAGITTGQFSGSIAEHLHQVFSQPVCFGLMTGSARANRKPVLGIFDLDGRELGFAKIGLSSLAADLVSNEHLALSAMNSVRGQGIQVPQIISFGSWADRPVLVMSALRPNAIQKPLELPVDAARAIISSAPVTTCTLSDSHWYNAIVQQLDQLATVPEAQRLVAMVSRLARHEPDRILAFGAWHGDFGAWNMARTTSAPMVWDWERYARHLPLGLDLYHFSAHDHLRQTGNMPVALRALAGTEVRRTVNNLHQQHGGDALSGPGGSLVPLLYLATIAARFIEDGHRQRVTATFELGRWHLEVMHELLRNTYKG
ncbi:hypothetical protein OK351_11675 [Glutamicibacter sp. MNS18]|uniref:hypothetical protein n=1 Tax=Glutamicibacter sp. MNS18 TaxID=2989817 RepID=UPI00223655F5|nr:hypothetical protein [Glutamicibacter sp. MNS18]MCW4466158.1 hypothetical protein [Glutamicibacter sp. MNS18]